MSSWDGSAAAEEHRSVLFGGSFAPEADCSAERGGLQDPEIHGAGSSTAAGDDAPVPPAAAADAGERQPLLAVLSAAGVLPVYALALIHYGVQQLSLPLLVKYINDQGWGDKHDLRLYGAAFLANVLVPFFCNPLVTTSLARWGLRPTLMLAQLASLAGFAVCTFCPHRGWFVFGWALTGAVICLRSARQVALAGSVPAARRTEAIALHSACHPIGALAGIGVTKLILALCDGCAITVGGGIPPLTQYTLSFAASGVLCVAGLAVTIAGVSAPPPPPSGVPKQPAARGADGDSDSEVQLLRVTLDDGTVIETTPQAFVRKTTIYFLVLVFLGSFVANYFLVALQPILANDLEYSPGAIANVFLISTAASVIPPVVMMPLSRRCSDMTIIWFGAVMKLVGAVLLAAPPLADWRVIAGIALVAKSSFFYFATAVSLFSKLLGKRALGWPFGYLLSAVSLGNAAGTLSAVATVDTLSGGAGLMVFAAPAAIVLLLLLMPGMHLDPSHPVVAKVAAAV